MNSKALFTIQSAVVIALVSFSVRGLAQDAHGTGGGAPTVTRASSSRFQDTLGQPYAGTISNWACTDIGSTVDQQQSQLVQANNSLLEAQAAALKTEATSIKEQNNAADAQGKASRDLQAALQTADLQRQAAEAKLKMDGRNELDKLRSQETEIAEKIITADAELSNAQTAVQMAYLGQETSCRTTAETEGKASTDKFNANNDVCIHPSQHPGQYCNHNGTDLAGSANRIKALRTSDFQAAYLIAYKNCLAGVTGKGAESAGAIAAAKLQLATAEDVHKKRIDMYNGLKKQLIQQIANLLETQSEQAKLVESQDSLARANAQRAYDTAMSSISTQFKNASIDARTESQIANAQISSASAFSSNAANLLKATELNYQGCLNSNPAGSTSKTKPAPATDSNNPTASDNSATDNSDDNANVATPAAPPKKK